MGKTPKIYFYLLVVILLLGGWYTRFLAARDDRYLGEIKLLDFPKQIENWQGEDETIDNDALNILQADTVLLRRYQNPQQEEVWFYASYHRTQKEGRQIHSPKHCYPGSGWEIVSKEIINLPLASGQTLTVNKMLVSKEKYQQLVLYWYQSYNQVTADEIGARLQMIKNAIVNGRTDGSLIRVSAMVGENVEATFALEKRFLELFYPKLLEYLPGKNFLKKEVKN